MKRKTTRNATAENNGVALKPSRKKSKKENASNSDENFESSATTMEGPIGMNSGESEENMMQNILRKLEQIEKEKKELEEKHMKLEEKLVRQQEISAQEKKELEEKHMKEKKELEEKLVRQQDISAQEKKELEEQTKMGKEIYDISAWLQKGERDLESIQRNCEKYCNLNGLASIDIAKTVAEYHSTKRYFPSVEVVGFDGKSTRKSTDTSEQSSRQSKIRKHITGDKVRVSDIHVNAFNNTIYCPIICEWTNADHDITQFLANSIFGGSLERLSTFVEKFIFFYECIRATQLFVHGKLEGNIEITVGEKEVSFTQGLYSCFLSFLREELSHICRPDQQYILADSVSIPYECMECTLLKYPKSSPEEKNSHDTKKVTISGYCDVQSNFNDNNAVLHEAKTSFSPGVTYLCNARMQAMCYANLYAVSRNCVCEDDVVKYVMCDLQSVAIAERYPTNGSHRDKFAGVHFISSRTVDIHTIIKYLMYSLIDNGAGCGLKEQVDEAIRKASIFGDGAPDDHKDGPSKDFDKDESGGSGNDGSDESGGNAGFDDEAKCGGNAAPGMKRCAHDTADGIVGHACMDSLSDWSDVSDGQSVSYAPADEKRRSFALKMNAVLAGPKYLSGENLTRYGEVDIMQRWLASNKVLWECHDRVICKSSKSPGNVLHPLDRENNDENVHPNTCAQLTSRHE